jgi:hypothetical protein
MTISEDAVTLKPEEHYNWSLNLLVQAQEEVNSGTSERTNLLLEAIAHALLGGLRDGLDYAARQANKPEPGSPISPGPRFEEDEDRP